MSASRTIADRLTEAASRTFVGRNAELDALADVIAGMKPAVLAFVHGPGGMGKSALVQAAMRRTGPGVSWLRLDCREIEPTPRGLLRAIGAALDLEGEHELVDVAAALGAQGPRVVLVMDTYETFGLVDAWFRQVFMPTLSDNVVSVVAGRDRPGPGWRADPGWAALIERIEVRPLGPSEAVEMLRSRGLTESQALRVNAFARGYPLALELAASALGADPDLRVELGPPPHVLSQLLDSLLSWLPVDTVRVVEAASTVRRVNEPILRALLEGDSARDAFERLRRLPFVEESPDGLLLHDVVRDAVARDLAQRDPEAHRLYRQRAARLFGFGARGSGIDETATVCADLVFLVKNPYLRECCFPPGASEYSVEPAAPADGEAIKEIGDRWEPEDAVSSLLLWWDRHPEAFSVARTRDGAVAAFSCMAELGEIDDAALAADPVVEAWRGHLKRDPLHRGEKALLLRRWLGRESGELESPPVSACWLDLKRTYMELHPRLRRVYSALVDLPALAPIFVPLGFGPVPDASVEFGGVAYQPVVLDFGEGSVDGWLSRLIDAEIAVAANAGRATAAEMANNPPGGLSRREIEVLGLLAEGASNRVIGERLFISEKTAGRHVSNIFAKLRVHTRAEAARIAAEHGLTVDRV